jgi:hypothetical protein
MVHNFAHFEKPLYSYNSEPVYAEILQRIHAQGKEGSLERISVRLAQRRLKP